jgi:hypothetical protein
MHCIMLRVLPITPVRIFKFPAWTGIIFLYNGWYLWPVLRYIFIVIVDLTIIAVACDP